jgi:phage head maturation protease
VKRSAAVGADVPRPGAVVDLAERDSPSEGRFVERFLPGCLRRSLAERFKTRVTGLFEHGRSALFGRQPIMEILRAYEEDHGAVFEAELVDGLPETLVDGIRRGLYGASVGCRVVEQKVNPRPLRSAFNPDGIEQREYVRVSAFDISLTPSPQYREATVALRSRWALEPGTIYRTGSLTVEPAWRLPAPGRRDYLADPPDYLAAAVVDYLSSRGGAVRF